MRYALIAVAISAGLIFARLAWIFLLRGLAFPSESAAGLEGDYLVFTIFGVSTLVTVIGPGGLIGQRDWGAYLLSTAGFLWSLPLSLAFFVSVIQPTLIPMDPTLLFGLPLALGVGVFGFRLGRSMGREISERPRP
jgi:hypothetical protein